MHGLDDDFIAHPEVFEYHPKQAAQELLRAQLEGYAHRGQTDSRAFRARLRVAYQVGVPVVDIQRRTGLARQTIYNAIKRAIGNELEDLTVLTLIAGGGAQTIDALADATGASVEQIRQAVSRLHHSRRINVLRGHEGIGDAIGVFTIAPDGLTWLQTEIDGERLRSTHDDAWTIFVAISDTDPDAIQEAAEEVLGADGSFGVIEATVAPSRMQGPEFAVLVRAVDSREAFSVVDGLWARLRQEVSYLPALHVVAMSPPSS